MNNRLLLVLAILLPVESLFAATVNVTSIQQLDDLAEFSFSIMSDNNGRAGKQYHNTGDTDAIGMARLEDWVPGTDEFCVGLGDHATSTRTAWFEVTEDDPYWHNHYYPVLGDNCNQTDYHYGQSGGQEVWGRGWVQFLALNNFFNRNTSVDKITFREPDRSTPVLSERSKSNRTVDRECDDEYVDYYVERKVGDFTVHMIIINYPDPGVIAPRTETWMMNKLYELNATKTDKDLIFFFAHRGSSMTQAVSKGYLSASNRDDIMTMADFVGDANSHKFRRYHELDGQYDGTEAIWMNSGATQKAGGSWGYLNIHVFNNPLRFTVQYVDIDSNTSRKLHVGTPKRVHDNVDPTYTVPMMKYVDGPFAPVDWSNFPLDSSPPARDNPVVTFVQPSAGVLIQEGGDLEVEVAVSDNDDIERVYLYKDDLLLRSEGTAPFQWNAPGQDDPGLRSLAAGTFTLRARAVDIDGDEGEASISVTVLEPGAFPPININFQPSSAPVPSAYLVDSVQAFGDRGNGYSYGWDSSFNGTRDRDNHSDQRYDTLNHTQHGGIDHYWEIEVPNGNYEVSVTGGDPQYDNSFIEFIAEQGTANEVSLVSGDAAGVNFISGTQVVAVSDGRLTIRNGPLAVNNKICFIDIVPIGSANEPPIINPPVPLVPEVGVPFCITFTATDADGDDITYVAIEKPDWMTLNSDTGEICGTPPVVGGFTIRIQARDPQGDYSEASINITVTPAPDPYQDWKDAHNVTDDTSDDDGDGIPNLVEFALGGNPKQGADEDRKPAVVKSGPDFDYKFHRGETSVTYIIERSTDLSNWEEYERIVDDRYGAVGSDCMVPVSLSGLNDGKIFLRLRVESQ